MFFPISTPICPYVPYVNASVPVGLAFRGGVRNRRGTTCLDGHCLRDHALATRQVRYPRFFLGKKTAFIVFFKEKSSKIRDESYFSQSWSRNFRIEVGVPGKLGVNESKKQTYTDRSGNEVPYWKSMFFKSDSFREYNVASRNGFPRMGFRFGMRICRPTISSHIPLIKGSLPSFLSSFVHGQFGISCNQVKGCITRVWNLPLEHAPTSCVT
jgi:hypothetical protein